MVVSICFYCSLVLETVPILYDNNVYTWIYIVVWILGCNYSPRELTARGLAAQTFDGKRVRAFGFLSLAYTVT